ncbi:hypothetical protein J1605_001426 [Eschrichtius robustus]|uniref:Uncharacterized protein n=1 Tax=Eschrichtius robustus TaxID=9764 RepID=A0AB34I301_ESCRO|nr:hypothetical protein J1605_001426 [Eschrichtius robustus]
MPTSHSCPQLNRSCFAILKTGMCLGKGQQLSLSARNVDLLRDSNRDDWEIPDKRMPRTSRAPSSGLEVTRPSHLTSPQPSQRSVINNYEGTSLVAQWLRICLPMQGSQVRALVWEDPTCHEATKPVRHNY